jgi:hypothetical protein
MSVKVNGVSTANEYILTTAVVAGTWLYFLDSVYCVPNSLLVSVPPKTEFSQKGQDSSLPCP